MRIILDSIEELNQLLNLIALRAGIRASTPGRTDDVSPSSTSTHQEADSSPNKLKRYKSGEPVNNRWYENGVRRPELKPHEAIEYHDYRCKNCGTMFTSNLPESKAVCADCRSKNIELAPIESDQTIDLETMDF